MSIETELRRTIELRNSLNNIKLEKADVLRQRQTIGQIRKQSAELRQLTKEFNRYVKKGGQVADGFEKGKWNKSAGNAALGARVISIINIASLVASFAGLGLSIGNTWLGEVRNEVNENKFDRYGEELGNQLKLIDNQKKRIDAIERTQQRNTADLDILSGAVGRQVIRINRVETGQTFLSGQFAGLQNGFNAATQAFNGALQTTRNELISRIEAIKRDVQNPPTPFNASLALNRAKAALDTALKTAKKQTEQEQRLKKLERERTAGLENQLKIATQRATQALATVNAVRSNFQNSFNNIVKEVARNQQLAEERERKVIDFLNKKQDKSHLLDLISGNIGRFYDTYLKPPIDLQLKPTEIKADVAVNTVSKQQQEINNIRGQLTTIERNFNFDISRLKKEIEEAGMTPAQENKLDKILVTVGVLGGIAPAIQKGQNSLQGNLNQLRKDMPNLTAQGVCRTMQPGGCSSNALNNLGNSVNGNTNRWGNLLDKANAAANAGQLAILTRLDNKMGPQLSGGISGFLQRFTKWLQLDRVFNVLIFISVIHNAYMLSNNLTQTLFSIIDNLGNTFFKNEDGEDFDSRSLIGGAIDGFMQNLFGIETWQGIKRDWAKYNRVYQAVTNLLGNIQSMFNSVYNVFDIIGNRISKIGNALRWFGTVADNAYGHMNQNNNFGNPVIDRLTEYNEAADMLDSITSEVRNVRDQGDELKKNKADLIKAVSDLEKREDGLEKLAKDKNIEPLVTGVDIE